MHLSEKKLSSELVAEGTIIKMYHDTVELENGKTAGRDVIRHPGGVCVVALTDNDEILMVRQLRYPTGKVLVEVPAGKLEWGEDHFACGKRELEEEGGVTADEFTYLGCLLPTPAYCSEIIHMYFARGLHQSKQHLDFDEFLDVDKVPFDKAVEMVMNNEIEDAKTQLAILKTKLLLKR